MSETMTSTDAGPHGSALSLVVVEAGVSDPSSTRLLAERAAAKVESLAAAAGRSLVLTSLSLRELLPELPGALASGHLGPRFTAARDAVASADGIIAMTPVYKAAPSALFSAFFQVLDNDLLIAKPVLLGATAGTARHALVVDEQLRALFAFFRALPVPTSLFASTEDWQDRSLGTRIERAAHELVVLMAAGVQAQIRDESWGSYQHEFGSAGDTGLGIDLSSDLMRLATGGTLPPRSGTARRPRPSSGADSAGESASERT